MKAEDLEGWGSTDSPLDGYGSEGELNISKLVTAQNRKKAKSGGFQGMGLSRPVLQGVLKKGYKIPTPIQRKTIPLIMEGKDVVAMARTGSGKTAAFLIPLFEKLKIHSAKVGARALILSPTRELSIQTLSFAKDIGKFTGLRAASVLGGESMENQFAALHDNPDIIMATPGRFMHVCVEMNLNLSTVEYVVFDEADRLFEMGFSEQLNDIIARLSPNRQTLLFSATLPKLLVDFARAGLCDPTLIRLDVETKISENLELSFFKVNTEDKMAALIYVLKNVVGANEPTVVFVPTKHHVEFVYQTLEQIGLNCTYVYSSLDPAARKINIAKFRTKKSHILIVTDIAARGIDIPLLDNVINFNFPPKAKLFVHRVGRVARAGRRGTAYTFVAPDEVCYLLELHMFMSHSIKLCPLPGEEGSESVEDEDRVFGKVPQEVIDDNADMVNKMLENSYDLKCLHTTANNAQQKYTQTRPQACKETNRRMKQEFWGKDLGVHPIFRNCQGIRDQGEMDMETKRLKMLEQLKNIRSQTTIFEVKKPKINFWMTKDSAVVAMEEKRKYDREKIESYKERMKNRKAKEAEKKEREKESRAARLQMEESSEVNVLTSFNKVIGKRKRTEERGATGCNVLQNIA